MTNVFVTGGIKNELEYPQHSISKSVLLHLLPGAMITILYVALIPLVNSVGLLSNAALLLGGLIVLIGFELGLLFYEGRKKTGNLTLVGVVFYREPLPLMQYVVLIPLLLVAGLLITSVFGAVVTEPTKNTLFFWLPDWFVLSFSLEHSKEVLLTGAALALIVNGLIGPIVEETYFRGYLLPRLSRLGKKGVLLNASLFAIYHFFTPWRVVEIALLTLLMGLVVFWKKNIYLGISLHFMGNMTSEVFKLAAILAL